MNVEQLHPQSLILRPTEPAADREARLLREEVRRLKMQVSRQTRELKNAHMLLDRVNKTVEAKDALGRALREAGERHRAYNDLLLDKSRNIIWLLDDRGRFVLCTKIFLRLTGTPNFDYLKNRSFETVLAPILSAEAMTVFRQAVAEAMSGQEMVSLQAWIDFARSGCPRYYDIMLRCVDGGDGCGPEVKYGVLANFTDQTDLMQEKERCEEANRVKSEFLATMSHEIRTPMNAILGISELLCQSPMDPHQQKFLGDIRSAAHALLALINDILDFSKIESGKMNIDPAAFNLQLLLGNLQSMFSLLCGNKRLALYFHVDSDVPEAICGDENRLRQVLTNLLSNAVKFTQKGYVHFACRVTGTGWLRFDVRDTGIGIRPEDAGKLYTPFEQLDLRRNRNNEGTGLGLPISHSLCELMGGRLWMESVYGQGSTFSVELPCVRAELSGTMTAPETPSFSAPEARVLLVDDIELNLTVAEAMLGAFDIKPDLAHGGREAVEMAVLRRYDLILMDHMMPELDGIEAARRIKSMDGPNRAAPIVAFTANVAGGANFPRNTFEGVLPKPLSMSALGRCLREQLRIEI